MGRRELAGCANNSQGVNLDFQFSLKPGVVVFTFCYISSTFGLPAFPGAEGYGSQTPGGRSGRIIEVTNLKDSGAGSFRAACEASGARIVVFRVSGTIALSSTIVLSNPFITISCSFG